MSLPFSLEEFLQVFREYNEAIGIAPLALMLLAGGLVALARRSGRHRLISAGLAILWLWSGLIYHLTFFSEINPAARLFGAMFVIQGALLTWFGVVRRSLLYTPRRTSAGFAGATLIAYALVVYPILGWAQGHGYPHGPSFGAPCPTTIFSIGMLLWTVEAIPIAVAVIQLAWAVIGTLAATQLGIHEDLGLSVAGALLLIAIVRRLRRRSPRVARKREWLHAT
jgi:hypothetical protein